MAEQRERLTEIARLLANPAIYATQDIGMIDLPGLMKEQAELAVRLEAAEEEWLAAAEALQAQTPSVP